jgi:hypothetical protein
MLQICDEVPIGFPYSFCFDETFDPYWREFAGQERLPFERFQTKCNKTQPTIPGRV